MLTQKNLCICLAFAISAFGAPTTTSSAMGDESITAGQSYFWVTLDPSATLPDWPTIPDGEGVSSSAVTSPVPTVAVTTESPITASPTVVVPQPTPPQPIPPQPTPPQTTPPPPPPPPPTTTARPVNLCCYYDTGCTNIVLSQRKFLKRKDLTEGLSDPCDRRVKRGNGNTRPMLPSGLA
ncbi:hypothetical protein DFH09DRAFT_1087400 [Mycena vulgaris]|nr:hypothetical protein DFH09DRAFT_1087400 [Mycena vulgaris]